MNHSAQFGNILKALREREKITAEALAKRTGISLPTIHKVENGKTQIRISNLHKAYRGLCKNQAEWLKLCVQWLASHPEVEASASMIEADLQDTLSEGTAYSQKTMEDMAAVCAGKTPADIKLIKRVAANTHNRSFTSMVKAYLDAVEPSLV